MHQKSFDITKQTNVFGKLALLVSLLLALSLSQTASARSLKPVKDVQTENEVIKLYNQALKFSKAERNVHARVLLEKAATYDPTSVSAFIHAALSEIYHDLGNPDRAVQEALKALHYDRSMKDIYYNLGLYCKDANRYEEGIQYLTKFAESASGEKKMTALSLIESLRREQAKMGAFTNNDPDYLGQLMAENSAHHWPPSHIPLKIYIEPDSGAKGFRPEFPDIARNAFITWYIASGKKLSFTFVNSMPEADINVEWTDGALKVGDEKYERMKAGLTTTRRRGDEIEHARIQIRTVRAFSKEPEPADRIKETSLHEIGHALGLNGHSTNTADIMYFGNTARQLPALTKRDKATMARLYGNYPPYPMVGVDNSIPYPAPVAGIPGNSYDGSAGGGSPMGNEQPGYSAASQDGGSDPAANASGATDDEHVSIPSDEPDVGQSSFPMPPTPADADAAKASTTSSGGAGAFDSNVSDHPPAPMNNTAGSAQPPSWNAPGASSGMPVQSWGNPAANQPPAGAAWQGAPRQPGWLPQATPPAFPAQPYGTPPMQPAYAAPAGNPVPYGQPAYQAPPSFPQAGQAWQSAPAPYYPPNSYPATQPIPQTVPYNGSPATAAAPQTGAGVGPEQAPAAQSNPLIQFAQQFFPQNNAQQNGQPAPAQANPIVQFAQQFFPQKGNQQAGSQPAAAQPAAGPTPGQMVDQVIQMFQPPAAK